LDVITKPTSTRKRRIARVDKEQLPTAPVSAEEIMASPRFAQGVADARNGGPFPSDYDTWAHTDRLWAYERGRLWGRLVPRTVVLKRKEAIAWLWKFKESIP
jgi:hypothetical protein